MPWEKRDEIENIEKDYLSVMVPDPNLLSITPDDMREMTRELLEMKIVQKVMGGLDVNCCEKQKNIIV